MADEKSKDNAKPVYTSYEDMVENLAKQQTNQEIPNSVPAHVSILISAMFKYAEKYMHIFCNVLSDEVYTNKNLIENAIDFVTKKNGTINIILEKALGKELLLKPLVYRIAYLIFQAHEKKKTTSSLNIKVIGSNGKSHFRLMDNTAYRLEFDKQSRKAIANFGGTKKAEELAKEFEAIFKDNSGAFAV